MLFYRNRVEEDLARIHEEKILFPTRRASRRKGAVDDCIDMAQEHAATQEFTSAHMPADRAGVGGAKPDRRKKSPFGFKETAAMIIAVFSLIGPYIIVFIGIIGLLMLWIGR